MLQSSFLFGNPHTQELQEQQRLKGHNVSVIDQSADSEEVQRALQLNPDISRERSTLLHGQCSPAHKAMSSIMVSHLPQQVGAALLHCSLRGLL